ncbi:DDRGK domain protein isoform X2 [Wolffia australiana]
MEEIFAGIVCMILVFGLLPLLWWRRRRISRESDEDEAQVPLREQVVRHGATRRMRRRPAAAGSSSSTSSSMSAVRSQDIPADSDEDDDDADDYVAKASAKKGRKKQEREAQRQAEEAARESRSQKRDYYDEMRRRKDEGREAEERRLEEEALAKKLKEEEAAELDFEKWRGEFSVDDEGTAGEANQDASQDLVSEFVEYIKEQKCIPLEDLAAEFKIRTKDCIDRITSLESTGRLSGVMDDRGKYIFISPEEMKAVADYIKSMGRVSISHLASKSNQFIDLDSKPKLLVDDGILAS